MTPPSKNVGLPQPKLNILEVVREAFLEIWRKAPRLIGALAIPSTLMLVLDLYTNFEVGPLPDKSILSLAVLALNAAAFTWFAISCHRIILLGDRSVPCYGILRWTDRETRFWGWVLLLAILYVLSMYGVFMVVSLIGYLFFSSGSFPLNGEFVGRYPYLFLLPGLYVFSRLNLILPATALDGRPRLKWAWAASAGNGLRLLVLVGLLPLILSGFGPAGLVGTASGVLTLIGLHLCGYAVMAFTIAILSVSYRKLVPS